DCGAASVAGAGLVSGAVAALCFSTEVGLVAEGAGTVGGGESTSGPGVGVVAAAVKVRSGAVVATVVGSSTGAGLVCAARSKNATVACGDRGAAAGSGWMMPPTASAPTPVAVPAIVAAWRPATIMFPSSCGM